MPKQLDSIARCCLLVALLSVACNRAMVIPAVQSADERWLADAAKYIEAGQQPDKEGARRQREAERALICDNAPNRDVLESLIAHEDSATRHAAIVAVMIRGIIDEPLARAILDRWLDLTYGEKSDALRAIDQRNLQMIKAIHERELRVFSHERDTRAQAAILLTVRDEMPLASLMPLLVEYVERGPDTIRILAYATALKKGKPVAQELKRTLQGRGAAEAIKLIERWEAEGKTPWPASPDAAQQ